MYFQTTHLILDLCSMYLMSDQHNYILNYSLRNYHTVPLISFATFSQDGMSLNEQYAIIWTNAGDLCFRYWRINFDNSTEISISCLRKYSWKLWLLIVIQRRRRQGMNHLTVPSTKRSRYIAVTFLMVLPHYSSSVRTSGSKSETCFTILLSNCMQLCYILERDLSPVYCINSVRDTWH